MTGNLQRFAFLFRKTALSALLLGGLLVLLAGCGSDGGHDEGPAPLPNAAL
jgi:hypothetical protein